MGSHGRINGSDPGFAIDDVPNTPTVGTATLVSATATVPVTAAADGGKVTYYKITSNPGSLTATSTSSSVVISNLEPSTSYTFTAQTGNPYWTSQASGATNSVTVGSDTAFILQISGMSDYGSYDVDSSNNIYGCGYKSVSGFANGFNVKYNNLFTKQWENQLTPSSSNFYPAAVGVDSSGNVYMAGDWEPQTQDMYLVKYNSSGVLQWQRYISNTYAQGVYGMKVDPSGNSYIYGYHRNAGTQYRAYVVKYNTSGSKSWDYVYRRGTTDTSFFENGYCDSTYLYLTGYCFDNTGYDSAITLKIDTASATLAYSPVATRDSANNQAGYGQAITADSSGNSYTTAYSGSTKYIVKHNSSGTAQWYRGWTTNFSDIYCVATDSSGNVYVGMRNSLSGYSDGFYVAKFNTSGTLQWERLLTKNNRTAGLTTSKKFMKVIGNYLIFQSNQGQLFKFPTDGTLTGTYTLGSNTYTWASTTATISSTALNSVTFVGNTWESAALTSATPTFTSTSSTSISISGSRI